MKPGNASPRGPRSWPLLGHLPFLVFSILKAGGNFAEAVRRMLTRFARGTLYLRILRRMVVISADPKFARRVLVDNASHFPKTRWEKRVLMPAMEDGLIILEGSEWRRHRAAIAPSFSASLMDGLTRTVADATKDRLAGWRGSIAVGHEMRSITNDVLLRFFLGDHQFSDEGNGSLDEYARTFARVEQGLESRVFDPVGLIDRVKAFATRQAQLPDALAHITQIIEKRVSTAAVEPRKKTPLDMMLSQLPEHTVSREIRTMAAAGATTAHLLTWLCYLLAKHPDIQRKLRDEVVSTVDDNDWVSTLEQCAYLEAVIHEGLRLYPPAPYLLRQASPTIAAESDPELPAPSALVLISVWAMHRHPDFWDSPNDFIPERWLEIRGRGTEAVEAFIPFGMGPRVCIGRRFALIEAMIILAEIIRQFELRATPGRPPRPKLTILTRPDRELVMELEPIRQPRHLSHQTRSKESGARSKQSAGCPFHAQ